MNNGLFLVTLPTPLSEIHVIHDGVQVTRANWSDIWSPEDRSMYHSDPLHPLSLEIKLWIERYFAGDFAHLPRLSYHFSGTSMTQEVLKTLAETIPGEIVSYRELAERSGYPHAIRRVGSIMAQNLIPLLVPCHRVVRSDGSIGQYSCGIERKKWLLDHEKRHCR